MVLSRYPIRRRLLSRSAAFLAVAACLFWQAAAHAQRGGTGGGTNGVEIKSSEKFRNAFRDSVAQAAKSTVRVQCNGKDTALGVVVGANGFILTQASDLEGDITVKTRTGETLKAELIGVHEPHGLALLKVAANNLTPVKWENSKTAAVGNWVASPGMGTAPIAVGVVSVATRHIPNAKVPPPPGTSGGGFLGIGLAETELGAVIGEVQPKSAAAKAGLKVDDVILSVSGKPTPDAETLIRTIGRYKPNDAITLRVKRGDEEMDLKATLGKRPAGGLSRGDFQNNLGSKLSKRRGGFPVILQHDTVLEAPNLGGPLVDLAGNVVGVNISRAGRPETYAIPSETIQAVLPDLMAGKLAPRPEKK